MGSSATCLSIVGSLKRFEAGVSHNCSVSALWVFRLGRDRFYTDAPQIAR